MDLFTKEVTFLSNELNDKQEFELKSVTKTATFNELDRRVKDQHKLHFMLVSIMKASGEDEMKIDSDQLYDFTTKAVKVLLVTNEVFTEQDKTEFLQDSGALVSFGMWLLLAKVSPFFQNLMQK